MSDGILLIILDEKLSNFELYSSNYLTSSSSSSSLTLSNQTQTTHNQFIESIENIEPERFFLKFEDYSECVHKYLPQIRHNNQYLLFHFVWTMQVQYKNNYTDSVKAACIDMAHSGHLGTVLIKRLLRAKVWFPNIDVIVENHTKFCLACQATESSGTHFAPLNMNELPRAPTRSQLSTARLQPRNGLGIR